MFFKLFVRFHVWMFRSSGGKRMSTMRGGKVLLLTTKGRKSGQLRTVPLMYIEDEHGNPVVTASAGGAPTHPAWFNNLVARTDVTVELPGKTVNSHAEVAAPDKRAELWAKLVSKHAGFSEYAKKAGREIPMVILKPTG
jgi:deazaflavin-dependent oxidoreductase (nitroreductase family)